MILSTDGDDGGFWSLCPLRRELAPVANTPLITLELQAMIDAGIREIGIVSDAGLARAARDAAGETGLDVDLVHIRPPAEAGLAGRLLAAEPFIGSGPFVAALTASLTQHDLGRSVEHLVRNRLGALVVVANSETRTPAAILLSGSEGEGLAGARPVETTRSRAPMPSSSGRKSSTPPARRSRRKPEQRSTSGKSSKFWPRSQVTSRPYTPPGGRSASTTSRTYSRSTDSSWAP